MNSIRNLSFAIAALALAAIAAVAAYWWDRQRPVDSSTQDAFEAEVLADSLDLQKQLTLDIDGRQLTEEKARADSEDGLRLMGLCNAWVEFNDNHPGDSSLENRQRACDNYRRFLKTGELPAAMAEPEASAN